MPEPAPVFRSGAQARVLLHVLQLIQQQPGGTYNTYAKARGRDPGTVGGQIKGFWERGWVKPDRELPAHWTITSEGEKVLRDHAHLLGE